MSVLKTIFVTLFTLGGLFGLFVVYCHFRVNAQLSNPSDESED